MHPAPSIILFTTLSGLGFGMLTFLGLDPDPPRGWVGFVFFLIAFALAVGGLLSSTFHLGHPERAWKAFSQWRSSWLSREGVMAVVALALMGLHALTLVIFDSHIWPLGLLGAAASLATIFTTSMIYAQMKTVPRWHHWSTPALFLGFALTGGALMTGRVELTLWLLPALAALQAYNWFDRDRHDGPSTIATATGLGKIGSVRAFEAPHTGENYLTTEMVYRVGRKHAQKLRIIALGLFAAAPFLLLLLPFHHVFGLMAVLSHIAGVLTQRWLFFAEARHVVAAYYGR
ncbi:MAG: dimethyl sulfoxide reductase anchor subunit [Silicimonas sp.]|nr:dimethyl sulfoxide reductase anchor subunit [Silicimonas sp.]